MKQLKVKLSYSEIQAMDYLLGTGFNATFVGSKNYADKAVFALLIEFALKKIKPHTYMRFDKPKTVGIPMPVACALMHYWQHTHVSDPYQQNVLRSIVFHIEPKILG
jgi:hypothetical protein